MSAMTQHSAQTCGTHAFHRRAGLAALLLAIAGCGPQDASSQRSEGMFGLFKSKPAAGLASTVAAEVGAPLKRETAFIATPTPLPAPAYNRCKPVGVFGNPPSATFRPSAIDGESSTGFLVAANGSRPPLALVNRMTDKPTFEIWQMQPGKEQAFAKQLPFSLAPEQSSWHSFTLDDAACLPGDQMLLGVSHRAPIPRQTLFLYDLAAQRFKSLGPVELDSSKGPPFRVFETWPVAANAALVLFHTDQLRLKAEVYAQKYDHLVLFSDRHPQGLEVLKLGLDDGNVRRWAMSGHTLWLDTVDLRTNATFVWSLDLSKVI
jgi:hypothetical protein